jgi:hypothetical protein
LNSAVYLAFCICISPIQILTIIFVYRIGGMPEL